MSRWTWLWSTPSRLAISLAGVPAVGLAWGLSLKQKASVVFCSIGDASTRQGEFLEAVAFAIQEKPPVIFVVEDNGYGIELLPMQGFKFTLQRRAKIDIKKKVKNHL